MDISKEDLEELFERVEQMRLSLAEAPVEFGAEDISASAAHAEEMAWKREWSTAYKRICSIKLRVYDKKNTIRRISRGSKSRNQR